MSHSKIIAYVTIPAGLILALAIVIILGRTNRHAADVRPASAGDPPPVAARSPIIPPADLADILRLGNRHDLRLLTTHESQNALKPPEPFRGIAWGSLLVDQSGMAPWSYQNSTVSVQVDGRRWVEIKDLHEKCYERVGDKLQFGSESVEGITYCSFDGRFYQVAIENPNPYKLSRFFSGVYGPAKEYKVGDMRFFEWDVDDDQTQILIGYEPPGANFRDGFAEGTITNVKLKGELDALQRAEALAELNNAKKD